MLLDTTVLASDPNCAGDAWQVLAHAAPAWGARLAITEVVLAEAVACYGRRVAEAQVGLEKWADRHLGAMGLLEARDAANRVMFEAVSAYEDHLRTNLKAANVEILPLAEIPHMKIVERATTRRRPCDGEGDGYRDTLNWLTLLALAEAEPEEHIIWVSNDSGDFGAEKEAVDEPMLHPHLVEDLDLISAGNRVSWQLLLVDVVLALVAEKAPGSESDLKQLQKQFRDASVRQYITTELLPSAVRHPINSRLCALPPHSQSANLLELGASRNLKFDVKGVAADGPAVAQFTIEVDATIEVGMPITDPADVPGAASEVSGGVVIIEKPLLLRGLVRLGKFEKPIGADIATIEALPDDPGRRQWSAVQSAQLLRAFDAFKLSPKTVESMRRISENFQAVQMNPETLERMRRLSEALKVNYDLRATSSGSAAADDTAETDLDADDESGDSDSPDP